MIFQFFVEFLSLDDQTSTLLFLSENVNFDVNEGMKDSSQIVAPVKEEFIEISAHEEQDEFSTELGWEEVEVIVENN